MYNIIRFSINGIEEYIIQTLIDIKTNDSSRCCFLSHDPNVWFNEDAILIDPNDVINQLDVNADDNTIRVIKIIPKYVTVWFQKLMIIF